jgi:hypothetical protein
MTDPTDPSFQRIDPAFRNGSLTVVGIVLGFSLSFAVQWATDPSPWTPLDVVAALLLVIGLALQISSLSKLLEVNSLEVPVYRHAKNRFLHGLFVTAGGVFVTIVSNAYEVGFHLFLPAT